MSRLKTMVNRASAEFRDNEAHYRDRIEHLHALRARQREGGSAAARDRHVSKGKLLPRERVERLVDVGTPFLELAELAGLGKYDGVPPGAGIITGIGMVANRHCMIIANDATVKGGTYFGMTCRKHVRAQKWPGSTGCRSSRSSIPAGPSCPTRPTYFPTRASSARSSTTRSACRATAFPRSPWSWARAPPAGPISPRCATKS
jgi:hypothetical protein